MLRDGWISIGFRESLGLRSPPEVVAISSIHLFLTNNYQHDST